MLRVFSALQQACDSVKVAANGFHGQCASRLPTASRRHACRLCWPSAGKRSWLTAIKSNNVKRIVALESGSGFIFPPGELAPAMPSAAGTLADFHKLTRIPIIIFYGDNFPVEPTTERGQDSWRVRLAHGPALSCGHQQA